MIEELRITDLGVISEATIAPAPGLTVVTGETGAGKTMVVSGIGLLLGERADARVVRTGAERARVEGRFRVDGAALVERVLACGGQLDDRELLVARHLTCSGRSRAYVGGAQVPAAVCADLAGDLIAVHGQSEQVRLAAPDRQRELLDRYAGEDLRPTLAAYRSRWSEHRALAAELARLRTEARSRAREVDLLRHGLAEIERVAPRPGEDSDLATEALRVQAADDDRVAVQGALAALAGDADEAGGALAALAQAQRALAPLAPAPEAPAAASGPAAAGQPLADLAQRLAEAGYALADVAGDLARHLDTLDVDPRRLERIAERRAALAGLTRKYGATADEVIAWAEEASHRLAELVGSDDRVEDLAARVEVLDGELDEWARRLGAARRAAAAAFAREVAPELAALAMPHARLAFAVTTVDRGANGSDRVELLFSANPGSEPRNLAKVASGGELSRVRLAVEVVLAAERTAGTLVFDEVDAGVGGAVAVEIGRRLARLATRTQVVVVTHLAQVAAFADRHYVVVKSDDGQVTTSGVVRVAEEKRAAELARMMAGLATTDNALAHAGELLAMAGRTRRAA